MSLRRADVVAGAAVAGLILPQAVAYSSIAGVTADRAILATVAGGAVYTLAGANRLAIISPTSSSAAVLASAIATMGLAAGTDAAGTLATLLTGLVGLLFLLAGALKLGGLTAFVSRPVLRGVAFGIAVTIIIRQLPLFTGISVAEDDILHMFARVLVTIPQWNWLNLSLGLGALGAILWLRKYSGMPGTILVLITSTILSWLFDLKASGVGVVGPIRLSFDLPQWPRFDSLAPGKLAELAVLLLFVLLAESWGTVRTLSLRSGDAADANREMRALGWSNLAASIVQGMPVGAGFSAGSASAAAGAQSRMTAFIAAAGILLLALVGGNLIALLPKAVLAAVVVAALTHALNPAPLWRLHRLGKDFAIAVLAILAVLALGVLNGMLAGVLLSLAVLIRRLSLPQVVQLGRLGSHDFVDIARHPDATLPVGVSIWRPAEPLFFGNAESVFTAIEHARKGLPDDQPLIVSLEESFDIDSSALDALIEFDARLALGGTTLHLARVRDVIRDLFAAAETSLASRCHFSVDDAVAASAQTEAAK